MEALTMEAINYFISTCNLKYWKMNTAIHPSEPFGDFNEASEELQ